MRQLLVKQKEKVEQEQEEGSGAGPAFPLGLIPPKTSDWRLLTTDQVGGGGRPSITLHGLTSSIPQDKKNFQALCRGQKLLPAREEARLGCYYSTRGWGWLLLLHLLLLLPRQPYYQLQPVPVEVLHPEPHEVE